jgi:predicted Zn-dependent protease
MRAAAIVVALPLAVAAAACATNPVTGQHQFSLMSEDQERQIGQQQDVQIRREMGVYDDRDLQQYVDGIGQRLAQVSERPSLAWHFTVVDVPAVNAFALPGGYVYITRGILPFLDNEAQLAGVLGHEIGHVTARHAAQQYSRSTGANLGLILGSILVPQAAPLASIGQSGLGLIFLKNGRDDESQADALGAQYASRAGWDPDGVRQMLTTLGRIEEQSDRGVPNWLATHPAADDRVRRVQDAVSKAEQGATAFTVDHDGYDTRIDGLVYGDNPDQGVVRGSTFLHAALRIAIEFPVGWDVTNGTSQVSAKDTDLNAVMVLEPVRSAGRAIEDVAMRSMQSAGFRALDGARTTINGLDAFVGTYAGSVKSIGRATIRAAHIARDRQVFLVAGIAPEQAYDRAEPSFTRTIDSFRPMTRGEAEDVRPNRIRFYTARTGDSWQSIAEHEGKGIVKATTLATMNDHVIGDQPRPGERLKIVMAG